MVPELSIGKNPDSGCGWNLFSRVFVGDDTQLYIPLEMLDINISVKQVEQCVDEIKQWMDTNKLKLNESKSEVLLIGSKKNIANINIPALNIAGSLGRLCTPVI